MTHHTNREKFKPLKMLKFNIGEYVVYNRTVYKVITKWESHRYDLERVFPKEIKLDISERLLKPWDGTLNIPQP